jgi:LPXTG-motif cell wall-anchored protein
LTTGSSTTTTTSVTATRVEATASDPVATKVSSPVPGSVQIAESKTTTTPPAAGFTLLGVEVRITAPASTAAAPLKLEFRLDGSLLQGRDETGVVVLRNGVTVPACTGAPQAIPDACVSSRARSGDDVVLIVLTSQASTWNFALSAAGTPAGSGTTVTSSSPLPFQATGSALPRTGMETQMLWLLAFGVVLAGGGSLLCRQALPVKV